MRIRGICPGDETTKQVWNWEDILKFKWDSGHIITLLGRGCLGPAALKWILRSVYVCEKKLNSSAVLNIYGMKSFGCQWMTYDAHVCKRRTCFGREIYKSDSYAWYVCERAKVF